MFLRRCKVFKAGASRPVRLFILFSLKYSYLSSGKLLNPAKLVILFLLNSIFLNLGCPPKVSNFSILF